ncbi:hypothetical protein [Phenylobacterium sp.]|uniref:hypothetical protein n=1 Tax=Phenylobacterium sp. TaxID=1871053 RepID=UPI0035B1D2AC
MSHQYDARPDRSGWTVFDRSTGETVVLARALQSGLGWMDAADLLERLNRRRLAGDRSIL